MYFISLLLTSLLSSAALSAPFPLLETFPTPFNSSLDGHTRNKYQFYILFRSFLPDFSSPRKKIFLVRTFLYALFDLFQHSAAIAFRCIAQTHLSDKFMMPWFRGSKLTESPSALLCSQIFTEIFTFAVNTLLNFLPTAMIFYDDSHQDQGRPVFSSLSTFHLSAFY